MKQLVAPESAAVAGSFQNYCYLRLIKQRTPCTLDTHHGEYLLQPVSSSKPVCIIIDLVKEHAEISADTPIHSSLPQTSRPSAA